MVAPSLANRGMDLREKQAWLGGRPSRLRKKAKNRLLTRAAQKCCPVFAAAHRPATVLPTRDRLTDPRSSYRPATVLPSRDRLTEPRPSYRPATVLPTRDRLTDPRPSYRPVTVLPTRDRLTEPRPSYRPATVLPSRDRLTDPRPSYRPATVLPTRDRLTDPRPSYRAATVRERPDKPFSAACLGAGPGDRLPDACHGMPVAGDEHTSVPFYMDGNTHSRPSIWSPDLCPRE